jgi:integrase
MDDLEANHRRGADRMAHARAVEDMASATQNHYQGRLNEFLGWCVGQHFIEVNPIAHVRRAKVGKKSRRRLRRAYSLDEMQRLARTAPEPRRSIYLIASLSGLRKNELRELQKQDCTPTGARPAWHLRAGIEKSRRGDKVPMLPECAELLEPIWQRAKSATDCLFEFMPRDHTLRADLKAAEIPTQDDRGRWADFHSFRYTFCTMLSKKLPIQQVKVMMRHLTISLTADLYHDLGLDDMGDEVCNLPTDGKAEAARRRDPKSRMSAHALPLAHTSIKRKKDLLAVSPYYRRWDLNPHPLAGTGF